MKGRNQVKGLRVALGAFAVTALTLGTMGIAFAQGSTSYETRADFVYKLDLQLGIKPVYPSTATFSDVPTSNAYYGYIEAAYQAGITNGITSTTFGPTLPLTRAEAAKYEVIAYGDGSAAQAITSTSFTDNAQIPTALVGYVAEANVIGLLKGFPNGSFQPNVSLTVPQEQHLLSQLATAMGSSGSTTGNTVKVTATPSDVSAGQFVTLSALVTDASGQAVDTPVTFKVTGSNAGDALLSGSSFVASQPGTYTIEAVAGSVTGTTIVDVYGAATGLKIQAPTSIVANSSASSTVTVSFVDANGNVVQNDTGSVTLVSSNSYAVGVMNGTTPGSSATAAAVNGVATFSVRGGSLPGSSATLTATSGSYSATTTLTTTTQTAASLSVVPASQYIAANAAGTTQVVRVQVLDQNGQPMLYGTYAFTVSISGPATFAGGGTSPESFVYNGSGIVTSGSPVTIQDVQGSTGQITITATATSLTSGSATVNAVIAGTPTGIQITPPTTTSFSQGNGSTGLQFGVAVVDSHGYPVSNGQAIVVTVKNSSGQIAQNIKVDGLTQTSTSGAADGTAVTNGYFKLTDAGTGPDAGTYTVQASDASGTLTSSGVVSFTEAAGPATAIKLTAPQFVSAITPQATFVAQIVDGFGNTVDMSGVPVTFSSSASGINPSTQSATTNSSGQAQVTFTVPGYVGSSYPVTATGSVNGQSYTTTASFTVESQTAQSVSVSMTDNSSGSQYYTNPVVSQSGDQVRLLIKATDQYGNQVTSGDKVLVTLTGSGSLTNPTTSVLGGGGVGSVTDNHNGTWNVSLIGGEAVFAATAGGAGVVSLQAEDESVVPAVVGDASFTVQAGTVAQFGLFDTSGNPASSGESATANVPVELSLRSVDAFGNPAIPQINYLVVPVSSQGGSFRTGSASGADLQPGQGAFVSTGSGGVTLYYVTGTSSTTLGFTAPYWVGYPSNTAHDQNGNPTVANGNTIAFTTTGTIVDATNSGNVSGNVFTAPASGSGTDTLQLQVSSSTVLTFTVSY